MQVVNTALMLAHIAYHTFITKITVLFQIRCMLEKHGLRMYMLPDMKILYRLDEENLQQWEEVERNYRKRRKQSRRKIKPKNP